MGQLFVGIALNTVGTPFSLRRYDRHGKTEWMPDHEPESVRQSGSITNSGEGVRAGQEVRVYNQGRAKIMRNSGLLQSPDQKKCLRNDPDAGRLSMLIIDPHNGARSGGTSGFGLMEHGAGRAFNTDGVIVN